MRLVGLALFAVLILLSCVVCLSSECNAQPEQALKKDFPILTKHLSATQPADFIIIVDKSGSMKQFWPVVKKGLALFVKAIPDNDYVSLIVFGGASGYLATPTPINESTRNYLISEIEKISSPNDQNTDLGFAFEKALHEANRPSGNKLKFIFFLTDFNHDASRTSPYYQKTNPGDRVWQQLAGRRELEQKGNVLQVYALLLPLEKNVGKDIALGETVFPEIESVNVNQATLLAWFERRKAEIARDKLRALIKNDCDRITFTLTGIDYKKPALGKKAKIVARIRYEKNEVVDVTDVQNIKLGLAFKESLPSSTKAEDAQPIKEMQVGDKKEFNIEAGTFSYDGEPFLKKTVNTSAAVSLRADLKLAPGNELAKLGLPQTVPIKATANLPLQMTYGRVHLASLLSVVAVVLLIICAVLYYLRPEYVVGKLTIIGVGEYAVKKNRKAKVFYLGDVDPDVGFQVPNAEWTIILRGFRPFEDGKKKRGVYGRMDSTDVAEINYRMKNTSMTNVTWVKIERGSTIEVDKLRISFS